MIKNRTAQLSGHSHLRVCLRIGEYFDSPLLPTRHGWQMTRIFNILGCQPRRVDSRGGRHVHFSDRLLHRNGRALQIAVLLLGLLFSWSNLVFASDAELLFEAGNKAYLDGDWDGALEKWKQVEQRGYAGGALFYNLGNAFYKKGELGEAILYWERAARLMGEEGDVASNLKIARARITDKLDESVHLPVWDWFDRLRNRFSAGFVAWGSVLLSFALFGALSMKRWVIRGGVWNQRLKSVVWVTAALLIIGLSQAVLKARDESLRREGVLVSVEAEVLSAPALGSGKLLFTLHEGTKVRVLRKLEGWIEINAGKDKQGWVKDDAIGVI